MLPEEPQKGSQNHVSLTPWNALTPKNGLIFPLFGRGGIQTWQVQVLRQKAKKLLGPLQGPQPAVFSSAPPRRRKVDDTAASENVAPRKTCGTNGVGGEKIHMQAARNRLRHGGSAENVLQPRLGLRPIRGLDVQDPQVRPAFPRGLLKDQSHAIKIRDAKEFPFKFRRKPGLILLPRPKNRAFMACRDNRQPHPAVSDGDITKAIDLLALYG
jgi:hypothetical protein